MNNGKHTSEKIVDTPARKPAKDAAKKRASQKAASKTGRSAGITKTRAATASAAKAKSTTPAKSVRDARRPTRALATAKRGAGASASAKAPQVKKASAAAKPATKTRRASTASASKQSAARKALNVLMASACLLALLLAVTQLTLSVLPRRAARPAPTVEIAAPPVTTAVNNLRADTAAPSAPETPASTEILTAEPTVMLTLEPALTYTPAPAASAYSQMAAPAADYSDPALNKLISVTRVYREDESAPVTANAEIHMGASSEYSTLAGVTTFRGSNYRDGGGYGVIPESPSKLSVVWKKRISGLDDWSGVGWTGQASVVRWPAELRAQMNINRAKKAKDGLVEALYATLDGHIYFLDLADGEETRRPINIGAPIKGSLTVDPRGVPLLYCGQGIYDVGGKRVDCGTRIWSLIDQKQLYFLSGKDKRAVRAWQAFDCSPLVDGQTDTMITAGENGVLYTVKLNTQWEGGAISVSPRVDRYVYEQTADGKVGSENSVVIYNNYAYFATNIGIIQCVDLNAQTLVWSFDARDDIDATMVIEAETDGTVGLYAVNELDKRGKRGACQMFKLNALTGELIWKRDSAKIYQNNENGGGGFATPALGRSDLSDLAYFHICRTEDSHGMLYALDKRTGETVWSKSMGSYGWSSPTCLYTPSGKGYVLVGSSSGRLRLMDGLTGRTVAETTLKGNIEGTPAVFDDMIVVGTRSSLIYGIRIQ